ncbi:MAG TPA: S8 family serine peptidase [Vicinamibacteria bacterium]|nr:S8 family serine peptidase [Vicinamibacteria bacterium]
MSPRRVRVGIVDSGINARDPQVVSVEGGVGIRFRGGRVERDAAWEDRLGHGTAVAATIRGHAPEASLYSIRVFHRALEAHFEAILDAIEWAAEERLDLLNLSLGCPNREEEFDAACARAGERGLAIVCAGGAGGARLAVAADYALEDETIRFDGRVFHASPWARPRGALPRERNFHGTSFAVAHVSGIAARILSEGEGSLGEALARIASGRS